MEPIIAEFPPRTLPDFHGIPLNGGRVQAIAVHPTLSRNIIVAAQFGGLWKTEDHARTWSRLDSLRAFRPMDVAYAPDGETVFATVARDNRVRNGGGIWLSRDGGSTWTKPRDADPPADARVPGRMSAYGISIARDPRRTVYVGTDFGVATSADNGRTWDHRMLETASRVAGDKLQNATYSVLGLPENRAIALSQTGIYRTDDGGTTWRSIRAGNFAFMRGFKNIDGSPRDLDKVFIVQDYANLLLYEVAAGRFTTIPLPGGGSRGPFVRVARNFRAPRAFDLWVGAGVKLLRATCDTIDDAKRLAAGDWTALGRTEGLHDDSGYLGLDTRGQPILYGSDGGLFQPTNSERTQWAPAASGPRGFNSYQITDLAGTNVPIPRTTRYRTSLYFTTQDNGIWASPDGGRTWPANDCAEGFHVEVRRDAATDDEVTVAYGKVGCGPSGNMFSDANLANQRAVPDVGTSGRTLTDMTQAFYLSPKHWIRFRKPPMTDPEIYVSENDGANWRRKAVVDLEIKGVFTVSGPASTPTVYAPFKGARTRADGSERIGLLKITGALETGLVNYGDNDLIYLPDEGSLGQRATEFDWQAVFGVDPQDPDFLIAPDVANQVVKVSTDGGRRWATDSALTRAVTRRGELLLYDEYPGRMQVTHITFDPYNRSRIFVGTKDAGVVVSEDRGATWEPVAGSDALLYITGFFCFRDNRVAVSTYGRGLWTIDFSARLEAFDPERDCRPPCVIRPPRDAEPLRDPIAWAAMDVTVFRDGQVNGLVLAHDGTVEALTVTPGTVATRYAAGGQAPPLKVTRAKRGRGFGDLAGLHAAAERGEVIKGVILEGGRLMGVIAGEGELRSEREPTTARRDRTLPAEQPGGQPGRRPYLMLASSVPMPGTTIVGPDGLLHINARGFAFAPGGRNIAAIRVDGEVLDAAAAVAQDGTVQMTLKLAGDMPEGEHAVEVAQSAGDGEIAARSTFVKAMMDEFE